MQNKKIWQKNNTGELNEQIEKYTVGNDYILDQELLSYDARASIAHAEMLHSIGILNQDEAKKVVEGLKVVINKANKGEFTMTQEDEDGHTAIENFLIETCGEAGKKIHTGRSRNDQVLVAMRLYMKAKVNEIEDKIKLLIRSLSNKSAKYKGVIMPGYTHMQRAMPSSVSMWLESFVDSLTDNLVLLEGVKKILNQNPLGSVVGYGETTLGLNRAMTTEKLHFAKTQENPMYCALSRGKFELITLQSLYPVMFDVGKLATDLMLFTTKEYNFCFFPYEFTTGSSAMPQKRNYDVLELVRGKVASFSGVIVTLQSIIDKLPSGYNRDFQLTKEPLIKGVKLVEDTVAVMTLTIENLKMHIEVMEKACTSELYATEDAYKLVKEQGMPFRDAYKKVAEKYLKN